MVLVALALSVAAMLLLYVRKLGITVGKVRATPPVSPDLPQKRFHAVGATSA